MSRKLARSIVGLLASFLLVSSHIGVAANADTPSGDLAQLSWKTPISVDYASDQPFSKLWVTQGFEAGMRIANIPHITSKKPGPTGFTDGRICDQLDKTCLPDASWDAEGYGFFQLCETSSVAPCIKGLEYADAMGEWRPAQLSHEADLSAPEQATRAWLSRTPMVDPGTTLEQFQTSWGWKADKSLGLPGSGKGPLVFKFPGRPNAGGTELYALDANFTMLGTVNASGAIQVKVSDFNFQISPVRELECVGRNLSVFIRTKKSNGNTEFGQMGGSCFYPAVYTTTSKAGFATKFADNEPIRLSLEMPKSLSGWFQGRLDSPSVTVSDLSVQTSLVEITGKPTVVPTTNKALELTNSSNQDLLGGSEFDWARSLAGFGYRGITGSMWDPSQGVEVFNKWAPYLDEKARGSISIWSISHFMANQKCMNQRDGLQGLVTTNAMVYQPATPTFNGGFLQYKVGGVHLDQDGKVVQGTYNFLMKKSVAQCLYGFTNAPISGTVSVTSAQGEEQVAYTSVTEKDGWLKLTAEGFTFSSPTISAKLTQAKILKKTIRCVKGKTVRTVTAVAPVCPKGFKKR